MPAAARANFTHLTWKKTLPVAFLSYPVMVRVGGGGGCYKHSTVVSGARRVRKKQQETLHGSSRMLVKALCLLLKSQAVLISSYRVLWKLRADNFEVPDTLIPSANAPPTHTYTPSHAKLFILNSQIGFTPADKRIHMLYVYMPLHRGYKEHRGHGFTTNMNQRKCCLILSTLYSKDGWPHTK